ncbi:hypothetical protein CROQUDRAFT_663389 [Cronartium quercuum f. sp. fusiforme G11]|uniref:Uncharacterized protein n=1 Tax=Cronartium quercuum f. sp. fusiforme G11 TaxID=708437 RepID=A0A9P6T7C0_9BASI|nr:hypothetical protein CROQUDRAFT_663389 [Cronartium quercuum f. sp. fusiforme G11]
MNSSKSLYRNATQPFSNYSLSPNCLMLSRGSKTTGPPTLKQSEPSPIVMNDFCDDASDNSFDHTRPTSLSPFHQFKAQVDDDDDDDDDDDLFDQAIDVSSRPQFQQFEFTHAVLENPFDKPFDASSLPTFHQFNFPEEETDPWFVSNFHWSRTRQPFSPTAFIPKLAKWNSNDAEERLYIETENLTTKKGLCHDSSSLNFLYVNH